MTPFLRAGAGLVFERNVAARFRRDYVFSVGAAALLLGVGKLTVQQWT